MDIDEQGELVSVQVNESYSNQNKSKMALLDV